MFKNKNTTPGTLAFYNALGLAILLALSSLFLRPSWTSLLIAFLLVFILSYSFFKFSLQRFVYRKIKLIYKLIYQTKATRREEVFNKHILPQKSLEEVSKDVAKWATDKKQEIEILKENEKYRKEFLLNLSHELKTPITAIQGYIHTLLDGAYKDPEVGPQFLSKSAKNIERLTTLIGDLDEITDIESGNKKLNPTPFIIQEEAKEAFHTLEDKAKEKGITFSIKEGCEAPLTVKADKTKVHRILANLINNAIKYGKKNGHIVASFYDLDGQKILTEISDNGIGIKEEHLPRIFERFYRTDTGRDRNEGGSGLGLAIVKHLVEAHHQTITVRSQPKVGTTFGFTLEQAKF